LAVATEPARRFTARLNSLMDRVVTVDHEGRTAVHR
jgi:hypothetical protein